MPRLQNSDLSPQIPRSPLCSVCGKRMRMTRAERAYFYEELEERSYSCECGEKATKFDQKAK